MNYTVVVLSYYDLSCSTIRHVRELKSLNMCNRVSFDILDFRRLT